MIFFITMVQSTDYKSIAKDIHEQGAVFLIGGGASEGLGYPSSTLIAERMKDYFNCDYNGSDIKGVAECILAKNKAKRSDLIEWLRSEFRSIEIGIDSNTINNPYSCLARISKEVLQKSRDEKRNVNLYFLTTNFDGELVKSFGEVFGGDVDFEVFASTNDFRKMKNVQVHIYLIRDEIGFNTNGEDTLLLKDDDFEGREGYNDAMYGNLRNALDHSSLFILGYGPEDTDMKETYLAVKQKMGTIKAFEVDSAGTKLEGTTEIKTELITFLDSIASSLNDHYKMNILLRKDKTVELSYYDDLAHKVELSAKKDRSIVIYGHHYSGKSMFINYLRNHRKLPLKYRYILFRTFAESETGKKDARTAIKSPSVAECTPYEREWVFSENGTADKKTFLERLTALFSKNEAPALQDDNIDQLEVKLSYEDAEKLLDYYSDVYKAENIKREKDRRKILISLGSYLGRPPSKAEHSGGILIPPLLEKVVREHKDDDLKTLRKIDDEQRNTEKLIGEIMGIGLFESLGIGLDVTSQLSEFLKRSANTFLPMIAFSSGVPLAGLAILGISGITAFFKGNREGGLKKYVDLFNYWNRLPVEKKKILAEMLDRRSKIPPGSSYSFLSHWLSKGEGSMDEESQKFLRKLENVFTDDFVNNVRNVVNEFPDLMTKVQELSDKIEEFQKRTSKLETIVEEQGDSLEEQGDRIKNAEDILEEQGDRIRNIETAIQSQPRINDIEGCIRLFGLSGLSISSIYITDRMRNKMNFIVENLLNEDPGNTRRIAIIGDPGTGKTTLLFLVLAKLFQFASEHREYSIICGVPYGSPSDHTIYASDNLQPQPGGPAERIMSSLYPVIITCTKENWDIMAQSYGNVNVFTVINLSEPREEWYGRGDLKNMFKKLADGDVEYNQEALDTVAEKSRGLAVYIYLMVDFLRKNKKDLTIEVAKEMPSGFQGYVDHIASRLNSLNQAVMYFLRSTSDHRLHINHLIGLISRLNNNIYFRPNTSNAYTGATYQAVYNIMQELKNNGIIAHDNTTNVVRFTHDVWTLSKLDKIEVNADLKNALRSEFENLFKSQKELFDQITSGSMTPTSGYWFTFVTLENNASLALPLLDRCIAEMKVDNKREDLGDLIDIVPLFVSPEDIGDHLIKNFELTAIPFLLNSPRSMIIYLENFLVSNNKIFRDPFIQFLLGNAYSRLSSIENTNDNLLRAIDHYENALKIRTKENYPKDYADTENNIGNAYLGLASIKKTKYNLLRAIDHYENALKINTKENYPKDYANTENNLGYAYFELASIENTKDNLLRAIDHYENALKIRTKENYPKDYADTENNIGNAYSRLSSIENTKDNLLSAIDHYENALHIFTREAYPLDYALTENNIGIAHFELASIENTNDNLLRAIDHYENALQVFTKEAYPRDYSVTENNIGNAYVRLSTIENTKDNLLSAIDHYENALKIRTKENYPKDYADTENNIGNAYVRLSTIENTKDNLLRAIDHLENALKIRTKENYPKDYSVTEDNLGNAYVRLSTIENTKDNLLRAIDHYENAFHIFTREAYPLDYADTENNIGNAYLALASIKKTKYNLLSAIDHYENALKIRTKENYPKDYANTENNLGYAYLGLASIENERENLELSWNYWNEAAEISMKVGLITILLKALKLKETTAIIFNEKFGIKTYCEQLMQELEIDLEDPILKSDSTVVDQLYQILESIKKNC